MDKLIKKVEEKYPLLLEHETDSRDIWPMRWNMLKTELSLIESKGVFLICCNDAVLKAVVSSEEQAQSMLNDARDEYLKKNYIKEGSIDAEGLFFHLHHVEMTCIN